MDAVIENTAEGDGGGNPEAETLEGLHPPSLEQPVPLAVTSVFGIISSYGWHVVVLSILGMIVYQKMKPKIQNWQEQREAAEYHKNPDKVLARERAIDAARLKLQEQYNQRAQEAAIVQEEKHKQLEEKKRREKIEDWERHERGEGYRNRTKAPEASPTSEEAAVLKPKNKARLRPEYNPMTGEGGGSSRYVPSRRGPSAGG